MVREGSRAIYRRDLRICNQFTPRLHLAALTTAEKGDVRYDRGVTDQFNSTVTYASIAF